MDTTPHIIVQVSAGAAGEAQAIASAVVASNAGACAQILPIRSWYYWEGELRQDEEWLILIKTRRDRFSQVEACIKDHHSYAVPEIVALPIVEGSAAYLQWIDATLASS